MYLRVTSDMLHWQTAQRGHTMLNIDTMTRKRLSHNNTELLIKFLFEAVRYTSLDSYHNDLIRHHSAFFRAVFTGVEG